jgi:sterol desaturase/sphingolipid hydroxylase (fatty acid hydroxylase superfamily)
MSILQLFEMKSVLTPLIVLATLVLLFVLERLFPLRKITRALAGRLLVNFSISALAFLIAALLVRPTAQATLHWTNVKTFGLVHLLPLPAPFEFALSFLLMDLGFYYWHIANHRVPFLWRFHNVHHIDPDLDVSTGFRFHFGEVVMSTAFRILQVSLIGLSGWAFAVYEVVFQANTLFHHSNLRLPIRFERRLNKMLVTPRMHGIHHSQVRRENNSNFGVVFPWWDRFHRTLGLNIAQAEIAIGIAGYSQPDDNRLRNALLMPFRKQRDYWRRIDGEIVKRTEPPSRQPPSYLAE